MKFHGYLSLHEVRLSAQRRGARLLAAIVIVLAAGGAQAPGQERSAALQYVHDLLTSLERIGYSGAAALDFGADEVMVEGYGLRDRTTGDPVTPETVFTLGSVTKQFTSAAVLVLVEDGRLSLNDSLPEFFPATPPAKAGITVHHLLTHTSGLPDVLGDDWDARATAEWIVHEALDAELISQPGEGYSYSNLGYSILGRIVEVVSSEGYESFLRRRFFEPLGMTKTGYVLPDFSEDELAIGYEEGARWGTVLERPMLNDGPSWNLRANGGIHTTPGDMLRWHRALLEGLVLSRRSVELAATAHVDEGGGESFYGYGWSLYDLDDGTAVMGHDGGNGIFSADFRRYPGQGAAILLFSSSPDFPAPELAELTQSILLKGLRPFVPPKVTLNPARMAALSGRYALGAGDTLRFFPEGSSLRVRTESCRTQYFLTGGIAPIPEDVAGLAEQTVAILEASVRGDFDPLRAVLPPGYSGSAFDVQKRHNRMQEGTDLGELMDVGFYGCTSFEDDQIRIVVQFEYEEDVWYRSLRWRESGLSGYGIHGVAPGGRQGQIFVPLDQERFRGFSLTEDAPAYLRFDTDGGRLIIENEAGDTVATGRRVRTPSQPNEAF